MGKRKFKVVAVSDTIIANSTDKRPRHCVHVQYNRIEATEDCWIEGIGSLKYGIIGRREFYYDTWGWLVKCTDGEEVLYSSDSTVGIPKTLMHKSTDNAAYDLQGRRLTTPPQRGVYVRDGRKVVSKCEKGAVLEIK